MSLGLCDALRRPSSGRRAPSSASAGGIYFQGCRGAWLPARWWPLPRPLLGGLSGLAHRAAAVDASSPSARRTSGRCARAPRHGRRRRRRRVRRRRGHGRRGWTMGMASSRRRRRSKPDEHDDDAAEPAELRLLLGGDSRRRCRGEQLIQGDSCATPPCATSKPIRSSTASLRRRSRSRWVLSRRVATTARRCRLSTRNRCHRRPTVGDARAAPATPGCPQQRPGCPPATPGLHLRHTTLLAATAYIEPGAQAKRQNQIRFDGRAQADGHRSSRAARQAPLPQPAHRPAGAPCRSISYVCMRFSVSVLTML